jgi:hypothetical protein
MTPRERFLATMHYQPRDHCPWGEMGFWPETLERWHREGWPRGVDLHEFFGFDWVRRDVEVSMGFLPGFAPQTLEETEQYRLVRRADGVVAREFRGELSFHMPQWVSFPLTSRRDWEQDIRPRLDPTVAARYPADWDERVRTWRRRDWALGLRMGSVFGWLRNWMGLEGIALALCDDPAWVQEMMDYVVDFCCACGRRALEEVDLDYVLLWEDMACKTGPLISPAMFERFMLAPYKRLTGFIRQYGVELLFVDSDGDSGPLIPLWLEGGVNGFYPMERVAGMDPVDLRRRFGRQLRLMGGIDKRAMAAGPAAIDAELAHVAPLLAEGGFIPWCDHHVPPDVPLAHYRYYVRRLQEASVDPQGFKPARATTG